MTTNDIAAGAPRAGLRARVGAFGGFLTAMVIPNVGAFIAWGFLTALFIPTGWLSNADLASVVKPMITYMLPLLLAYTGGRLVHGQRGGVAGMLGTIGLIVGADIPMFLGAMVMGPLGAWLIKKIDRALEGKIKSGFEMVVNNFTLGFLGLGLITASYWGIGPIITAINQGMLRAIHVLVDTGVLPLLSLLNEPAKVLFLNNVIDQGLYYPLGLQDAAQAGKSIFFTVASNPGPGLGLLVAFWLFGHSKVIRNTTPGAIIIHFLGGIHEIYFPYVLMKPLTIIGMIAGGMAGIATFSAFDVGLVAGPSPGSIFSYLALTPPGNHLGIISGVLVAAVVSFLVTSLILKMTKKSDAVDEFGLQEFTDRSREMKAEGKAVLENALAGTPAAPEATSLDLVRKVVFACDAGMGSSVMGASSFKKKLTSSGREDVEVVHSAIESISEDADVVVVHKNLADRVRRARPNVRVVTINNYLGDPALDDLRAALTTSEVNNAG
ncbi:PTS mannitol transporter subunit IICB [Amycolatopsis sp. cmx-8-4]|uniref:PTS mannitol transporter subunit IICB n=1 Tax=Amycolatopsis sp. cmx-8-4 TaxID=2790947 RepID=UPI0039790A12